MLIRSDRLTVEIADAGPSEDPDLRYSCRAVTEDGRRVTGNPAESIDVALQIVPGHDPEAPVARTV